MQHAADRVGELFSRNLGTAVTVQSINRTFPGNSRETWLVRALVNGEPQGFVLRIDLPEGSGGPQPMQYEFEIYRRLYGSEVPVAEPLWWGEGEDFAEGRAYMVRRLVEGSTTVDGLFDPGPESVGRRRRVAYECVEKLATLHRLDWKALGFDEIMAVPAGPEDAFRADFQQWRQAWGRIAPYPAPVLEEAMCWLEPLIPTDCPRVSLFKGNNGLGEEIWQGERIIAMSDWEVSGLGDGLSDLFWSQGTLRLIDFNEIVRYYGECMGQAVSPERLAFAAVFATLKQYICGAGYWYAHFHHGRTKRVFGFSCRPFMTMGEHKLALCLGKTLEEAAAICSGSEKSFYAELGGSKK